MRISRTARVVCLVSLLAMAGCAVNPVTKEREFALVSTGQEIQIGEQQYGPLRQMAGGDLVVDPGLTTYVKSVGARVAATSDRELPYEFVVINESTPNAWALPGGKIAVHRGLLTELDNEAELAAVLGHEVVHAAARHGAKSMERGMLLQGVAVAAAITANQSDYGSLIMTAAGLGVQLVTQKYGRDAERESDYYGMKYMSLAGYDPAAAVTLQEAFVRLSGDRQSNWLEGLFASHPPSVERVQNNREALTEFSPGGDLGRERYQAAISRLVETKDAYDAHDRGRKALADGDTETALQAAEQALRIEPLESQFHALRGDVRAAQGRWSDARVNYDRAVNLNPAYFYPLMRRGQAHYRLDASALAAEDLERSLQFLPSAPALNTLGNIRLEAGARDEAIELFRAAAQSDSPDGRAAARSLVRLDLPQHPSRYIKTRIGQDGSGRLVMEIRNATPLDISIQQLALEFLDDANQVRSLQRAVSGVIRAGEAEVVSIDPRLVGGNVDPRRVRAAVSRARIAE